MFPPMHSDPGNGHPDGEWPLPRGRAPGSLAPAVQTAEAAVLDISNRRDWTFSTSF